MKGKQESKSAVVHEKKRSAEPNFVSPKPSTNACYGCGSIEYICSNCPTCSKSKATEALSVDISDFLDLCDFTNSHCLIAPRPRPLLRVNVLGTCFYGLLYTAAKQSVAGRKLYEFLLSQGQSFLSQSVFVRLADGSGTVRQVLVARVDVYLNDRTIPITFLVLLDAQENHMLIVTDYHAEHIVLRINLITITD